MFVRSVSIAALSLALVSPAFASEVKSDSEAAKAEGAEAAAADEVEQSIVVTGQRLEYGVKATRTATRTATDLRNIPQSLSVISERQIEDQALRSIADVLTYVPGATPGTGEGNRDQITLRGNNTTADFFIDGIRDDVQYFRDLYNADRVEVLRGPNAMIFGRGGGGGIVNRVTKRSSLNSYREFALSGGSEGGYRFTADVDQPLTGSAGLRVNSVYEKGESFRRGVELERYAVNPTVGIEAGPNTRVDLSYEYLRDRRTADRGVPSFQGRPLEGADRTFFGDPEDSFSRANVHLGTFGIEHQLGQGMSLRNRTQYGDYDKFYQNIYPNGAAGPNGVRLSAYNDTTRRKNLFSQTDLVWENRLAGIDQTLLVGFELGRQEGRNQRRNGFFQPSNSTSFLAPVSSPTIDANLVFRPNGANNDMEASVAAFYVQDQLRLSPMFEVVAGLRFDRFKLDIDNLNNGRSFSRTDELLSPRIGLIAKPMPNLSLYASYGRSYLPQSGDQFNSLDLTSEALKPEKFDNYELGAKWEPLQGLLATAAIYQLDRTNTRASGPNPGQVVLTGAQRSRGLELGLERSVSDRWQISAGYAYQEAEVTRATSACKLGDCEVPLVPRHQLSLWNRYDVSSRIGVGLGVVARSKSFASISNDVELPGYTRVDAALFYELAPGLEAQVNVENLLGEDYFPTAHNDNNIAPGAPRTASATLRFRF
ncbi:MAG TPA: TonB-dependent siderophore receptor [Allosphingosinicella sp.]|nr:TonB-dependent siderophore receptor [Allosphingosinicella sp.]